MGENVNPWDYRYERNICNLLMVLKLLIYQQVSLTPRDELQAAIL